MGNVIAEFTTSLDGYIASRDGDDSGLHSWVFEGTVPVTLGGMTFRLASEQSAAVFTESISNAGIYIMGKRTFVAAGENPPFQKPTFVLSHEQRPASAKDGATITFLTTGIESALHQAKATVGDKAVYVFGGANVAQQFLKAGLIDEIHINLMPLLFGDGIRLFEHLTGASIKLEVLSVVEAPGITHLRYRVVR